MKLIFSMVATLKVGNGLEQSLYFDFWVLFCLVVLGQDSRVEFDYLKLGFW